MGNRFRTLARPRQLASLAVFAALAGLAPSGDSSDAAQRRSDSSVRRVWPVALTGLRGVAPIFCETVGCGKGTTATSAFYPEMLYPYPTVARNGDLYLIDSGNPSEPLRVIGLDGRIKRVVRVPGGVSRMALSATKRIAVVGDGNVIREISPTGSTRIVAGDHPSNAMTQAGPEACTCGDGGPARKALLLDVSSMAYDPQGRIVLADSTTTGFAGSRRTTPSTQSSAQGHLARLRRQTLLARLLDQARARQRSIAQSTSRSHPTERSGLRSNASSKTP